MIIQETGFGDNVIRNIEGKKANNVAPEKHRIKSDSVKISHATQGLKYTENVLNSVEPEYPPRTELVRSVAQRIAKGTYNNELLVPVAEKVVDSEAVKDIVAATGENKTEISGERTEKVDTVYDQVKQDYYNNPVVLRKVAERLITTINLAPEA